MNFNDMNPTVKSRQFGGSDTFNDTLKEAISFFAESNIQMVSGINEILGEQALFCEYVNRLTEGMAADEADVLEQLLENCRYEILRESTVSQVTPITGLAMPTIRKMWVKTALKNAIPTEAAKKPSFSISWMEPYMIDGQGKKTALPQAGEQSSKLANLVSVPMPKIGVSGGQDVHGLAVGLTHNLIALAQAKHGVKQRDAIDPIVYITGVVVGTGSTPTATDCKVVSTRVKLDVHSGFYARVNLGTTDAPEVVQLFGNLDCETGEMTITSVGGSKVLGVVVDAKLTQENNERVESVGFDVRNKDIRIGTGSHLNAELPIEWLQDTMALYNIDGTVECVDLMSNVVAQKLDQEIIDFLEKSNLDQGAPFTGSFDVRPAAGFAGSPTEWRHELRTTIEWWANRLKSYTLYTSGHFVLVGHPIDIQLIPDIQWQFQSAVAERAGVHVNYDFGIMTASNVFQVVASENVRSGELVMFFVPNTNNYKIGRAHV